MTYNDWIKEIAQANQNIADIYGVDIEIAEHSSRDYDGIYVNGMDPWNALTFGLALCEASFRARTIEGYTVE